MYEDDDFRQLEEQLRAQAASFGELHNLTPIVSALFEKHEQRVRRRYTVAVAVVVASLALLLTAVGFIARGWPAGQLVQPRQESGQHDVPLPHHEEYVQQADPPEVIDEPHMRQPMVAASPVEHGLRPADNNSVAMPANYQGVAGVPVVLVHIDGGGQKIEVRGVYVPRQVQHVPLTELSPPERRAVRMVLGLESSDAVYESL